MNRDEHDDPRREGASHLSARVKANAGSAGLGAACLLFFGFLYIGLPGSTLEAAWNARDWFLTGQILVVHTLRVGGVVLALVALASLTGRWPVLMVDAVTSIAIGALLMVSAVLMLMGSGDMLQSLLLLIFGGMFIRAGWNNAPIVAAARRINSAAWTPMRPAPAASPRPGSSDDRAATNLAGAILERRAATPVPDADNSADVMASQPAARDEPRVDPPPEGFLASFAPRNKNE